MAAGTRIVGGAIPGTGLFVHESKPRDQGAPPKGQNAVRQPQMAALEEKRVNDQLVEMLERKCAKQRSRAEDEMERRTAAEAQLDVVTAELEEARRRLEERDRQVSELCAAQRDLANDRLEKARCESSLGQAQAERDEARNALKNCKAELSQLRSSVGRTEAEWKEQVVRLVAEVQTAQRKRDELLSDLAASQEENEQLTRNAQDVVRRYEEESARRLELESRCLSMEEKVRAKEQRTKVDLDSAQAKAKQSLQARERAEGLSRQRDEKCQRVEQRAEAAEAKCRSLEAEVQRLKNLCADRARRVEDLDPSRQQQRPPAQPSVANAANGGRAMAAQPSKIPPPPVPRAHSAGSRPGSASSVSSAVGPTAAVVSPGAAGADASSSSRGARLPRHASQADDQAAAARMPPGAIRRAGSVPTRKGQGRSPDPAPNRPPARPNAAAAPSETSPTRVPGSRAAVPRGGEVVSSGVAQPSAVRELSAASSRPASRASSQADRFVEDAIPSEPDSSDEEVLTVVRTKS